TSLFFYTSRSDLVLVTPATSYGQ
ncbi:hypothetical protein KGM_205533B, partial [Danaus plexippus plexippus]